jgi:6-phosphofructokinase 1
MKKIGILTSGGDCQALNPTMRGVVKGMENLFKDVEIYGFLEGYKGMIYGNYKKMEPMEFSGLLAKGGTVLGTSRVPFKYLDTPTDDGVEKVPAMIKTYKKLELDGLFVLGGNGSQKTAYRLYQEGLNVIGLPKTIDNDIWGTDVTFGFQSAIDVATHAIDCIYTTA